MSFPGAHSPDSFKPSARRKRISLPDLAACGLIVTSRDSAIRRVAEKAFTQHGLEMWTVLETGECSLISEYVKMRLGVGRVHEACIRGKLDANICARDLKSPFGRLDVVLIYRKDRLLTAAQRRFVAAIAEKTGDAVRADSRISVERDR